MCKFATKSVYVKGMNKKMFSDDAFVICYFGTFLRILKLIFTIIEQHE